MKTLPILHVSASQIFKLNAEHKVIKTCVAQEPSNSRACHVVQDASYNSPRFCIRKTHSGPFMQDKKLSFGNFASQTFATHTSGAVGAFFLLINESRTCRPTDRRSRSFIECKSNIALACNSLALRPGIGMTNLLVLVLPQVKKHDKDIHFSCRKNLSCNLSY